MINEALAREGLEAVNRFIESFNSRSPEAFAAALNYPHVRPAHFGRPRVFDDAESYVANHSYQGAIDMGWDHSEWDYTHAIHTSERKIHVAGQWTRYNADGGKIISTPIVYIVTHVDNSWGIQSRFAADFVDDEDVTAMQQRAFKLVESFVQGHNRGNRDSCAELLNYPHFEVNPGAVRATNSDRDFVLPPFTDLALESMVGVQTGRHTANLALELTATDGEGRPRRFECVALVTERDAHIGLQAWSLIAAE